MLEWKDSKKKDKIFFSLFVSQSFRYIYINNLKMSSRFYVFSVCFFFLLCNCFLYFFFGCAFSLHLIVCIRGDLEKEKKYANWIFIYVNRNPFFLLLCFVVGCSLFIILFWAVPLVTKPTVILKREYMETTIEYIYQNWEYWRDKLGVIMAVNLIRYLVDSFAHKKNVSSVLRPDEICQGFGIW